MAPSRARNSRKKQRAAIRSAAKLNAKATAASKQTRVDSVEQLLSKAKECEGAGNFEQAVTFFDKALALKPCDASTCEDAASVCLQLGLLEKAMKLFKDAIAAQPLSGFEKYAYLSQLLGNTEEALDVARQGIELIRKETLSLDANKEKDRIADLRVFEASAHCSVAEICLGIIEDSNDPDVARQMDPQVESAVMAALAISDEGSDAEIEAMISLANLRLSQGRRNDAVESMKRVLYRMSNGLAALDAGDGSDATVMHALGMLPPFEIRIAIGKQLVEVEMWNAAISTLASVMWECDFNVEVWYLLAVAYWKLGDIPEARNALENTRAALQNPDGFDGQLDEDMIDKLYRQLDGKGISNDATEDTMEE